MVEVTITCISSLTRMRDEKLLKIGTNTNFIEGHSNYITAFQYVNKSDTEVLLSDSHPIQILQFHLRHQKKAKHDIQVKETQMFYPLRNLNKINKKASVNQTKWKLSKVKTSKMKFICYPFLLFSLQRDLITQKFLLLTILSVYTENCIKNMEA